MTHYLIVNPTTGSVDEADSDTYALVIDDLEYPHLTINSVTDAAIAMDERHLTVIPLVETFEFEDGEIPPNFDQAELAGLDGTLRTGDGQPYTWRQVAEAALLKLERIGQVVHE